MGCICSVHQPSYWPYLGLFDKIARSDVFMLLDDVQYVKNGFKNRNKVFVQSPRAANANQVGWLTLPVRHEHLSQTIQFTKVMQVSQTFRKHLATVAQAYGGMPGMQELRPRLARLYREHERDDLSLADIGSATVRFGMEIFGITTEVVPRSSEIRDKSDEPTQRLIDICRHVGADTYLAGAGGKGYMRVEEFERQGVRLIWQEWHPFMYPQAHSPGAFVPYLSCLDLLCNLGRKSAECFPKITNHVP